MVDELPPITVHASARDLALLVWGRADPGSANVDVTGDDGERGALRGLLAAGLTP